MQDNAVWAVWPIPEPWIPRGPAVVAKLRLGVAVGGGGACTRNVRGDKAAPMAGRFFRPLILSPSLTVLTNLVQTVEFDGWSKAVMTDVPGAVAGPPPPGRSAGPAHAALGALGRRWPLAAAGDGAHR